MPPVPMVQQLREMWERYWLLQEDSDVPDLLDFCRDVGLYSWVEALGGEKRPQEIVVGGS
ncbi:hypothetical protein PG994_008203 [Apiospora phragmitis]|uniref:Uncharacterized protein n=1 Tax=Apiospora phragmitis TaxID=2905665 RepID=A0ABR1UT30_9PEZI